MQFFKMHKWYEIRNPLACKNWEELVNKFAAKTPFLGFWRKVTDFSKFIYRGMLKKEKQITKSGCYKLNKRGYKNGHKSVNKLTALIPFLRKFMKFANSSKS